MTVRDAHTLVSDAQAVTGSTSIVSTHSIPLSAGRGPGGAVVPRDIGVGGPVRFRVHVTETLSTSQEMTVKVIVASNAALTTNVLPIGSSVAMNTDLLEAGAEFDVPIPGISRAVLNANGDAFLGLRYDFDGVLAAGAVSSWLAHGDSHGPAKRYRRNFTAPGETTSTPA